MPLKTIKLSELKGAVSIEEHEPVDTESRFYRYYLEGGRIVDMEVTANNLMDRLTKFSIEMQTGIISGIVHELRALGDQVQIRDDFRVGDKPSHCVARVARVRHSVPKAVMLLVTR